MYARSGLDALRRAVAEILRTPTPAATPAFASGPASSTPGASFGSAGTAAGWLLSQTTSTGLAGPSDGSSGKGLSAGPDDRDQATSSAATEAEQTRLIALVELARSGDTEAFGLLYDHYNTSVFRFIYYRVGSTHLAEDLTGETFFRALRSMSSFKWQGRDFGAWLMTIARNLTADHFKSSKTRLEQATEETGDLDSVTEGPEDAVLSALTNEVLLKNLRQLPADQQDCLVMRFLQGLSLAETAEAMERSTGAIKQLQLRAVRNLAALMPEGLR